MSDNNTLSPVMRWLTLASRLVVGVVFIVSGCTKMIDLWGFIFKISDYLAVWHLNVPQPLILTGAALLSLVEFTSGTALMLGCYRRLSLLVVTALMAVMLPLTVYIAIASPVADCGCFGDWLVISNTATLLKNIAIAGLLVLLWIGNGSIRPFVCPSLQWISTSISILYAITIGITGYTIQPLVDFRPYPVGVQLNGETDDYNTSDIIFVYEKDGISKEFTADNLPDDSWTFVDRIENNNTNADTDTFAAYDSDGDRYTLDELTSVADKVMLVLIPDISATDPSMTFTINELHDAVEAAGGSTTAIIGGSSNDVVRQWRDFSLANYPIYTADPTDIKIVARGTVALVMTDNGRIVWKRTINSIDPDIITTDDPESLLLDRLQPLGRRFFLWITLAFALAQVLLVTWSLILHKKV